MTSPHPTNPLLAMRAAILVHLASDAALAALMGGTFRLHDEPPRGATPVYAIFGEGEARDDSVLGARRHWHQLDLAVIGRPGSSRSALEAAERIAARLDDAPLALVLIRVAAIACAREEKTGEIRATIGLDAVTEATP